MSGQGGQDSNANTLTVTFRYERSAGFFVQISPLRRDACYRVSMMSIDSFRAGIVTVAGVVSLLTPLAAQRRPAGQPQDTKVPATINLKVSGAAYAFSGPATCEHLQRGSIYDTPAERWSVQQADGERSLSLTVWRPLAGGDDMITLAVSNGGKRVDVSTVKGRQPTQTTGSGTVKLTPAGKGGTFTIDARTASGGTITGTITCEGFTTSRPVAGD